MKAKSLSVVITAYNEAETLADVLTPLCDLKHTGKIKELIVVDDGSTDNTQQVMGAFNCIHRIIHDNNLGKAQGITDGIAAATGDIVVILDADLAGISETTITELAQQLMDGTAQAAVGLIRNPMSVVPQSVRKVPKSASGQRAYFRKDLLPLLEKMGPIRYGLEMMFNVELQHLKTVYPTLTGITSRSKFQKVGVVNGSKEYVDMFGQAIGQLIASRKEYKSSKRNSNEETLD